MRIRLAYMSLVVVGIAVLSLAACAPDKSAPTLPPREAAIPTEEVVVEVAQAADVETLVQSVEPFTDFECQSCHQNQEQLVELAVEEENVAESLSSGPG